MCRSLDERANPSSFPERSLPQCKRLMGLPWTIVVTLFTELTRLLGTSDSHALEGDANEDAGLVAGLPPPAPGAAIGGPAALSSAAGRPKRSLAIRRRLSTLPSSSGRRARAGGGPSPGGCTRATTLRCEMVSRVVGHHKLPVHLDKVAHRRPQPEGM